MQRCLVIMKIMWDTLETARMKTGQNETQVKQIDHDASELLQLLNYQVDQGVILENICQPFFSKQGNDQALGNNNLPSVTSPFLKELLTAIGETTTEYVRPTSCSNAKYWTLSPLILRLNLTSDQISYD